MASASIQSSATIIPFIEPVKQGRDLKPLRLITCGSVDDGKSTLIGRLLWDTKAVKDDQATTLRRDSGMQNDLGLPDFALLLDGLQAEREQGITIDVAYRYFATDKRAFIVADTPGHEQYTRNMATGASTADIAVLLVDARSGILEQTRRHATIASLMGIRQFILAVNKIDLTSYDKAVFSSITHQFKEFAQSLGIKQLTSIPISALKGENVVMSGGANMPWYEGPTLVQALEGATVRSAQTGGFRLPIQRVSRPSESFRGYQGTVAGGAIKPSDSVMILPSGEVANVSRIVTFDLVRNAAVSGDAITIVLDRQVDISRGDLISSIDIPPQTGLFFDAKVVALQPSGIEPSKRYWLKSGSRRQRVSIKPISQLNLINGQFTSHDSTLAMNVIGKVQLIFDETAVFDPYEQNRSTGSFILIDPDTNNTIAGGMITGKSKELKNSSQSDRVILSLSAELADEILASPLLSAHRDQIEIRRTDAESAATFFRDLS